MKTLSEKILEARNKLKLSRKELGDLAGVSDRSVYAYEMMGVKPRKTVLRRLADILRVSPLYLDDDSIDDPQYGIEMKEYVAEAASRYGEKAAKEMELLLSLSTSLFAGGEVPQEDKDKFFDALASSYYACREEARRRYGRKDGTKPM